jgi:hypothetical protein
MFVIQKSVRNWKLHEQIDIIMKMNEGLLLKTRVLMIGLTRIAFLKTNINLERGAWHRLGLASWMMAFLIFSMNEKNINMTLGSQYT